MSRRRAEMRARGETLTTVTITPDFKARMQPLIENGRHRTQHEIIQSALDAYLPKAPSSHTH